MIVTDLQILRQKSVDADYDTCIQTQLFERLIAELKASSTPGVGLAAIQIGIPVRACVVWIKSNKDSDPTLIKMMNPIIEDAYEPVRFNGERCLSLPRAIYDTQRFKHCVVSWYDVDTRERKRAIFSEIEAVVLQHEVDHMDGILALDRLAQKIEKIGRNDPCPCGSGKKYKKCCSK